MEEDPDRDLSSLHYQIMFPPREPCHLQREYELEQHLALMDEPATSDPAKSMDMGDWGNLTIEHLSSYGEVNETQEKFLLLDEDRYPKEDMLDIGIEASDLGSLLQQFEQNEEAVTLTNPNSGSEAQQTSSASKQMPGFKNLTKKIAPVKRKSAILVEPLALPNKRLRDKDSAILVEDRMSVSLPGSRTSSPLTVKPKGMSVICSADQGFDYLVMDHDYCTVNLQEEKPSNQTNSSPSSPADTAAQLSAEKRKALYKQKYKIRKKGKMRGRVTGGQYSEKTLVEGLVGQFNKQSFINKLPDYIHPMPEVSAAKSTHVEMKQHTKQVLTAVPVPPPDEECPPKGKKPEFFDKIPDYFIGKHMYQEISKVEEQEAARKQAMEEEMTQLKEKSYKMDSSKEKSEMDQSKDSEGVVESHGTSRWKVHTHAHQQQKVHTRARKRKVHTHAQIKATDMPEGDTPVNIDGQVFDPSDLNYQQPTEEDAEQRSHPQNQDEHGKGDLAYVIGNQESNEIPTRRKYRRSSYSEQLSRSRASSHSSSSSGSSVRCRSYSSSSSSDSSYSRSRHRGRSYVSRSRSRSYTRSRSRSRSHSYRRRRRRYSTYSSASHSSSSMSRSRSRSHPRSRRWRPRSPSSSYSGSQSRSRSRSRSNSQDFGRRHGRQSSRRESYQRTHSRSCSRRRRRSASIEQIEERREKRIEEQIDQWKDRRVVYIGRIPYGTTRNVIRKRFEKFGEIERITLHFRDEGDNYAFVTYNYKCDAYAAVEGANKDPDEPVYDICFGGRRQFCKSNYEDLDSMANEEEAFDYGYRPSSAAPSSGKAETDFDRLLQEAMKKAKR